MTNEHILSEWDIIKAYGILEKLRKYCKARGGECRGCQLINEDDPPYDLYCYLRNGLADWIHAEYWAIMNTEEAMTETCSTCRHWGTDPQLKADADPRLCLKTWITSTADHPACPNYQAWRCETCRTCRPDMPPCNTCDHCQHPQTPAQADAHIPYPQE